MKDNHRKDIENILEVEGVNAQGYGIISQSVMFDRNISVQSKAIYAYLASYTGSGRTVFPKRETILTDLKMSKNAFYRHFNPLVKNGYIKVSKAKGFKNKNVYTICNNTNNLNCSINDELSESMLILDGINAKGFGFIPKLIMCDIRLSVKAKALIAFFYSLVQAGYRAFPHRSTICIFLRISKDTYYKALNELIEYNYITVKQRHTKKGRFTVNDYILNSNPAKQPCPKNEVISETPMNTEVLPCPKNEDIINTDRVLKIETLPCPKNEDNNNSTSINSIFNITPSNQEVSYIPYTHNLDVIKNSIHHLTRFSEYSDSTDTESRKYCKTVKSLIEMLSVKSHARYSKQFVKTVTLFEELNDCIMDDIDGPSLRDLIMQTIWDYDIAAQIYSIKHPTEYLKALLWDEIKNFNL